MYVHKDIDVRVCTYSMGCWSILNLPDNSHSQNYVNCSITFLDVV